MFRMVLLVVENFRNMKVPESTMGHFFVSRPQVKDMFWPIKMSCQILSTFAVNLYELSHLELLFFVCEVRHWFICYHPSQTLE
jgi:hypothetical protein